MKIVTTAELLEIIRAIKGATFATITLSTEPKMRKTDNPFYGLVKKIATHNVCLNFIYENAVNRQRAREEKEKDFTAGQRVWGEHETAAIVWKNGVPYLQVKLEKTINTLYVSTVDNTPVDAAELATFLPEKSTNKSQGVDAPVLTISPKFENIVSAKIKGEEYIVKN
jgi:hypothetical protein